LINDKAFAIASDDPALVGLLNSRLATPKLAWIAFGLMVVGAALANVAVLQGDSTVMFTSYPPMKAAPHFYFGLILFAVGALVGVGIFFRDAGHRQRGTHVRGSVPLVTFGAITAAIIAVFTIASGAVILVPTFLWSVGIISNIDPLIYKVVWWGMGHSSQQINVSAHVALWYMIAALTVGAVPLSEKVSRTAFLLYILFLQLASAHHLMVEPGISSEWKVFNTSYFLYLAVLGSMIHGLTVPGAIEAAQRRNGFTKGAFEWLRKAPWGNPAFAGMFLSLVMFGFMAESRAWCSVPTNQPANAQYDLYLAISTELWLLNDTRVLAATYPVLPLIFQRSGVPEAREDSAVPVRHRCGGHLAIHDGSGNAWRSAPALGHNAGRRIDPL
jgi:cytochrome c oxidase subunit 1